MISTAVDTHGCDAILNETSPLSTIRPMTNNERQVADFHCPHRTCQSAGLSLVADNTDADTQDGNTSSNTDANPVGKEFDGRVGESFSGGYWEEQEQEGRGDGARTSNPYMDAVVLVKEERRGKKLKVKPGILKLFL